MTCQITSEMLKIPDLNKTGLAYILDLPQKGKSLSNHTPRFLTTPTGERKLPRILAAKDLLNFSSCIFEPKRVNSVSSGFSFNLLADNHFLTSSKQLFNMSKA